MTGLPEHRCVAEMEAARRLYGRDDRVERLSQLAPAIVEARGTDHMIGIYRQGQEENPEPLRVGDYQVRIRYD